MGGAGKVSVLAYTMPFWLLLLAWPFLGERLRGLQWPAVALAFAGLVLVVRPWDIGGALSGVLACTAGLVWAAAALLIKLLQRRTHVDTLSLTAWQMAFGAVPLIAIAVVTQSGWPQWTGTFAACVAYTVFLSSGLCYLLWFFALRALSAGAAGMGTLAVPVIGVMAAWIELGERPLAVEAVGMALIVAGLAVLAACGVAAAAAAGARSARSPSYRRSSTERRHEGRGSAAPAAARTAACTRSRSASVAEGGCKSRSASRSRLSTSSFTIPPHYPIPRRGSAPTSCGRRQA